MNHDGKIILSILWTDSELPTKLKDSHFFIYKKDNVKSILFKLIGIHVCSVILLDVFISAEWHR